MVTLQLIKEIRSDEFYIPGFSTDELDIIVSTSTIKSACTVTKNRILVTCKSKAARALPLPSSDTTLYT